MDSGADAMAGSVRAADGDWRGRTGDAFASAMRRGVTSVDDGHAMTRRVGTALADYSGSLSSLQARMSSIRAEARAAGLAVHGFVIEEPGSVAPHPGAPPQSASQGAVDDYDADVAAYNRHQELIRAYNVLAGLAQEVWDDVKRAWERVAAADRALDGQGWTFLLSDLAGGLAGAAIAYNASALRGTAQGFQAHAQREIARLRSTQSFPARYAQQFYDDLKYYDDVLKNTGDDVSRAARLARIGRALPLAAGGVLTGAGIWYDMKYNDESAEQAVASNVGGFAASVAMGAAVGTMVGGPVGTVAGVIVGAAVGVLHVGDDRRAVGVRRRHERRGRGRPGRAGGHR